MKMSLIFKVLTLTTGISITQGTLANTKSEDDKKEHGKVAKLDSAFLEYLALTSFEGDVISDPLEMLDVDEDSLNASFDQQDAQMGQDDKTKQEKVVLDSKSEDGTSDSDSQKQKEEK